MNEDNIKVVFILIVILTVVLGIVFLGNTNVKSYEFGEEIRLGVNEQVNVGGLRIKLTSVIDSTCPEDAECILSGEYTYQVVINGNKVSIGSVSNMEYIYKNYTITLFNDTSSELMKFKVNRN